MWCLVLQWASSGYKCLLHRVTRVWRSVEQYFSKSSLLCSSAWGVQRQIRKRPTLSQWVMTRREAGSVLLRPHHHHHHHPLSHSLLSSAPDQRWTLSSLRTTDARFPVKSLTSRQTDNHELNGRWQAVEMLIALENMWRRRNGSTRLRERCTHTSVVKLEAWLAS